MSEEIIKIPKEVLLKLAESNRIISDKLEKISKELNPKRHE